MENLNAEVVKKALECCILFGCSYNETKACPLKPYEDCTTRLVTNALALIASQEQDKEKLGLLIDELEKEKRELFEENKRLTEENERLRADCVKGANALIEEIQKNRTIEADTVKEFAERLKANTITIQDHTGKLGSVVLVGTIDQIAKEMLEGE